MEYAKQIDPAKYDDLFQDAWMDMQRFEKNNPEKAKEVINYKYYFYRTLKNKYLSHIKKNIKHLNIDRIDEEDIIHIKGDNICPESFLNEWLEKKPTDDLHLFYQNMITLVLVCKDTSDAIRQCKMSRGKFYEHLNQAKQKLKNDYISTTNTDNSGGDTIL